ncbi:hypothetical protein [Microbacterium sp. A94]|uniref:hypothetical protein n=1 Tax=Microbacterium sp. A94 TaxID=3450717 RepID=UPI003F4360B4
MARPKAPCGTYPAYRRHLRAKERVDDACREAQRNHDAGRSTSAPARQKRVIEKTPSIAPVVVPPAAQTDDGNVSRVEVLQELLQESRELVKELRRTDPARVYLQMREQREILRELSELQGNGQEPTRLLC